MRTTLTLEPDVAALVKRAMRERKVSLKVVVNEAIRAGLTHSIAGEKGATYELPTFEVGRLLVPSLDDTSEVLSWAEGDPSSSVVRPRKPRE